MNNIYYSPEKFGLQIFESIDTAGSWEFDTFVIFKRISDGALFWTSDSGCSCPTPFESIGIDDLNIITKEDFHSFDEALKNHSRIQITDYLSILKEVKDELNTTIQ